MVLRKQLGKRWRKIILALADMLIVFAAVITARFILEPGLPFEWKSILLQWITATVLFRFFIIVFKADSNIWRYANAAALLKLELSFLAGGVTNVLIDSVFQLGLTHRQTFLVAIISALASSFMRTAYKALFSHSRTGLIAPASGKRPIAIIGAGAAGVELMREMARNNTSPYTVWGFFDDDKTKLGLTIDGVQVKGTIDEIPEIIKQSPVHDLVLAIPSLDVERRQAVTKLCQNLQCRLQIMPDIILSMRDSGDRLTRLIRDVKIEDLLGRTTVTFSSEELSELLLDKVIIVTGGGGSIGSELCRQIAGAGARTLVIFDVNENTSYLLQNEIRQRINSKINIVVEIGSMTDKNRVIDIFSKYRPDVVFHAAAHKHVPLMEHCPYEAVVNNIFGTYNIIAASSRYGVKKFVLISTDKAVNPTSVMGATKRYCENMMLAYSKREKNTTCFVAVRFGNVLGSSGSVIPIFQAQIAHGGPVTLTDKRITRYFMTISEAVSLVLRSGAIASSSQTYILDMGQPVKILTLAENLIRLSGFEPYRDIEIQEVGLRPGEKLYEELLVKDSMHTSTHESKIFIENNQTDVDWDTIALQLKAFSRATQATDNDEVLSLLREFVPGYHDAESVNAASIQQNSEACPPESKLCPLSAN